MGAARARSGADRDIATIAEMDGIISYTIPPPEVMAVFGDSNPPMIAITMCRPSTPSIAYAHIDPNGVAERVVDLLEHRHCRSYAFCSPQTPYLTNESAALLSAYRRQVFARTGQMPQFFRPVSTLNFSLISSEVERFTDWLAAINHVKAATEAASTLQRLIRRELTSQEASYEIPLADVTERASTVDERGSARIAHEARVFIGAKLKQGISPSIRDITFHLNVSARKIEKDFLAVFGHTLHEEVVSKRLDLLCRYLRTSNEPIKILVARSGYRDISQATRAFKARFGMTMGEYRQ